MKQLRDYQIKSNNDISRLYKEGKRKIIFQLCTGGGKTLTTTKLIERYLKANPSKTVLFIVHRERLLEQFKGTMESETHIMCDAITAGTQYRDVRKSVFVCMVQTAYNRLKKNPLWFGQNVGMVVFDEAHLGVHKKMHDFFEGKFIVGLTATPLAATKKDPLKNYFEDIVSCISGKELIANGSLCQNITYHIKDNIDYKSLKLKAGEFDNKQMGSEYSKKKNVHNVVKAYEDKAKGKKTIIFNCNVEHSKLVNQAFLDAGYDSKHLDGTMNENEREAILEWFDKTDGAILNNIDILTAGADFPTIECVIINRATMSLTLWMQACGRGSRPTKTKNTFIILDLGGNAMRHGDWSDDRDWKQVFFNPPTAKKVGEEGVAPIKICINPDCEAIIPAQSTICKFCEAKQPLKEVMYDKDNIELVRFDMGAAIEHINQNGYNPYSLLHKIKGNIVKKAHAFSCEMNETRAYNLIGMFQIQVQKWCKEQGKRYDSWHKETTTKWIMDEIEKKFGYKFKPLELKF